VRDVRGLVDDHEGQTDESIDRSGQSAVHDEKRQERESVTSLPVAWWGGV
jgi:hypothetical protein